MMQLKTLVLIFLAMEGPFASVSGASVMTQSQTSVGLTANLFLAQNDTASGDCPFGQVKNANGTCAACPHGKYASERSCVAACPHYSLVNEAMQACEPCDEGFIASSDGTTCIDDRSQYQISSWVIDYFALVVMFFGGISTMGSKVLSNTRVAERENKALNIGLQVFYSVMNGIVLLAIFAEAAGPAIEIYFTNSHFSTIRTILFSLSLVAYGLNVIVSGVMSIVDRKKADAKAEAERKAVEAEMIKFRAADAVDHQTENSPLNDEASLQSIFGSMKVLMENVNLVVIHSLTIVVILALTARKYSKLFDPSMVMPRFLDFTIVFTMFWLLQFHVYLVMHELNVEDGRYKNYVLIVMAIGFFLFALVTPWLVFVHAYLTEGNEPASNGNNLSAVSELFGFSSGGLAIGLGFIDVILARVNERQGELDSLKDIKRKLSATVASMNCCEDCKPVEKRVVTTASMTHTIATLRNMLSAIPGDEIMCKWIPELSRKGISLASLLTHHDAGAVNPESEMVESCKTVLVWNLELPISKSCPEIRSSVEILIGLLTDYLHESKLKRTTRALAAVIPADILVQLLVAAGYFSSFANVVTIAPSLTMSPKSILHVMLFTGGVVIFLFLLGTIAIVAAVKRLKNMYTLQQGSVHLVADTCDSTDAGCPRGHYQAACSPSIVCKDCPAGTWSPFLFEGKPVTKCFSCDDGSGCPPEFPEFDPTKATKCHASLGMFPPCRVAHAVKKAEHVTPPPPAA